jgi:hypothetical protein
MCAQPQSQFNVYEGIGAKSDSQHWYELLSKLGESSHKIRTIANNKPDTTIRDKDKGTCTLINVANSECKNVTKN